MFSVSRAYIVIDVEIAIWNFGISYPRTTELPRSRCRIAYYFRRFLILRGVCTLHKYTHSSNNRLNYAQYATASWLIVRFGARTNENTTPLHTRQSAAWPGRTKCPDGFRLHRSHTHTPRPPSPLLWNTVWHPYVLKRAPHRKLRWIRDCSRLHEVWGYHRCSPVALDILRRVDDLRHRHPHAAAHSRWSLWQRRVLHVHERQILGVVGETPGRAPSVLHK